MADVSGRLIVDEEDLNRKTLTCSKYQSSLYTDALSPCKAQFDTWIKFKIHIRRSHRTSCIPSKFQCPVSDCKDADKSFSRLQFLQNHYDCIHRQSQEHVCAVCQKKFSSSKSAARHEKDCLSGFLKCNWCDRTFSHNSSLSRHCRKDHLDELLKISASKKAKSPAKQTDVKYIVITSQSNGDDNVSCQMGRRLRFIQPAPTKTTSTSVGIVDEHIPTSTHMHSVSTQSVKTHGHSSWAEPEGNMTWGDNSLHQNKTFPSSWSGGIMTSPYTELTRPPVSEFGPGDMQDKQLFSALDNITTQTDEFWGLSEFSTQTYTEHNSFGTQTRCPDVLDSFMGGDDLVEYLDGEVQTETEYPRDSASLALQTNISPSIEERGEFANSRSCGVDRLDRDCQTNYFKNSTHTQTKMRRERALVVVDGLNSHTQTASPPNSNQLLYNESFTQTMDAFT